MAYNIDDRDVRFCVFEHLDAAKLTKLAPFREHDESLYRMIIEEAIKFAREEVAPTNGPADEEGCRLEGGQVRMPKVFHELWKKYREAGWNSVTAPTEIGGQGLPSLISAAASEGMVGANCSFVMTPGLTIAAINMVRTYGTDEMKRLYLEKMVQGQWSGTMCLTEPNVGTFLGDIRTTAKRQADGSYRLTGTKMFITSGDQDLTENIIHIVLGRAEGSPKGIKGLSLFLVPKLRVNADGKIAGSNDVVCSKIEEKMGIHGSATCMMNFGDTGECAAWIIGQEGDGIQLMFNMMNEARIGVGMQGVALAGVPYQMALQYAKERVQGTHVLAMKDPDAPRIPIIEHPDVRRMLLEMKAFSEACRAMVYYVAKQHDIAEYSTDDEERQKAHAILGFLTPVAKAYPTDRAFEIASTAIQVMGGVGYCREYGVEQYCRDAKVGAIYEGTNGVQALDLVGRKLTSRGGQLFMTYMMEVSSFIDGGAGHPTLEDLFRDVGAARDKIADIAMHFMQVGPTDPISPVLAATPFLEGFGHLVGAHMLVEQARIAQTKLDAIAKEKGVSDLEALAKSHEEARFYFNKVLTARFFVKNILPRTAAIAARIQSDDQSCLKAIL